MSARTAASNNETGWAGPVCAVIAALVLVFIDKLIPESVIVAPFIFKKIQIPWGQWAAILGYVILWKTISKEKLSLVFWNGVLLGFLATLYPQLLKMQELIWGGLGMSRIYMIYIHIYILIVNILVISWGAVLFRRMLGLPLYADIGRASDTFFMPVIVYSVLGIALYFFTGHLTQCAILMLAAFLVFFLLGVEPVSRKAANAAKAFFMFLSRPKVLGVIIFAIALSARVLFLLNLLHREGFSFPDSRFPMASDDGDAYDTWGWNGSRDMSIYLTQSPHYYQVFYSVFISLLYKIFGRSYLIVGIAQGIICALMCVGIYALTFKMSRRKFMGFFAGMAAALNSTLIHLSATYNTESLFIPILFFSIMSLYFYREAVSRSKSLLFIMAGGALFGLASLVREPALGILPFAFIWIIFFGRKYQAGSGAKRITDLAAFIFMILAVIVPITITNYKNTGKFELIYMTGRPTWTIISPYGEDLVPSNRELIELGMKDPFSDPAGSIKAAWDSPGKTIMAFSHIVPKRMLNFFFWGNFGYFDPVMLITNRLIQTDFAARMDFYYAVLFAFSFLIFLGSASFSKSDKMLVFVVLIFYILFHGVFVWLQTPRYRAPADPFTAIIFGCGFYSLIKAISYGISKKEDKELAI